MTKQEKIEMLIERLISMAILGWRKDMSPTEVMEQARKKAENIHDFFENFPVANKDICHDESPENPTESQMVRDDRHFKKGYVYGRREGYTEALKRNHEKNPNTAAVCDTDEEQNKSQEPEVIKLKFDSSELNDMTSLMAFANGTVANMKRSLAQMDNKIEEIGKIDDQYKEVVSERFFSASQRIDNLTEVLRDLQQHFDKCVHEINFKIKSNFEIQQSDCRVTVERIQECKKNIEEKAERDNLQKNDPFSSDYFKKFKADLEKGLKVFDGRFIQLRALVIDNTNKISELEVKMKGKPSRKSIRKMLEKSK